MPIVTGYGDTMTPWKENSGRKPFHLLPGDTNLTGDGDDEPPGDRR